MLFMLIENAKLIKYNKTVLCLTAIRNHCIEFMVIYYNYPINLEKKVTIILGNTEIMIIFYQFSYLSAQTVHVVSSE